jgi:hypothetical protein
MESRVFIREAAVLIIDIENYLSLQAVRQVTENTELAHDLQTRINQLFSALQNPTLPSAETLRTKAVAAGFTVSNKVSNEIDKYNTYWDNVWY